MTDTTKRSTLLFLGLAVIITILIAASLPQLEFQPGMPLPQLESDRVVIPAAEARPFHAISIDKFIIAYVLLLVAASMLYMLYKLLRGAEWKNFITFLWPVLLIGLVLGGFAWLIMLLKTESAPVVQVVIPTSEPPVRAPLGAVPLPLLWLVGSVLLAAGVLIGIWIIGSRASSRTRTLAIVGLEAEKAWQEIKTGLNLKDVIIKCYRQMSLALEKEQGIERKDFMTTREFEIFLET